MREHDFMQSEPERIRELEAQLAGADAVVVGAGAGLSAAAGMTYSGRRFQAAFPDFIEKYHFSDMYSGGFYPFPTQEEYWAYWSRYIWINRYRDPPGQVYRKLLELLSGKEYFVLTTNVDHCFQKAGFGKQRLFYTQGDYGLFQCSAACHSETYGNEAVIRAMVCRQENGKIPSALIPRCPLCGEPMRVNLRCDDTFVQDAGWYRASGRYQDFIRRYSGTRILFWELGVGGNTPGIIKYPFRQMTARNPQAIYACINLEAESVPAEISARSICILGDIGRILPLLRKRSAEI